LGQRSGEISRNGTILRFGIEADAGGMTDMERTALVEDGGLTFGQKRIWDDPVAPADIGFHASMASCLRDRQIGLIKKGCNYLGVAEVENTAHRMSFTTGGCVRHNHLDGAAMAQPPGFNPP